jgi:hypothetical protein
MKNESYKTILIIVLGLIVLSLVWHSIYFIYAALVVGFLSAFSQTIANTIHCIWMKLAKVLSYIMPNIILGILFYLVLSPIALLQRFLKKNKSIVLSNNSNSTLIESNRVFDKSHFEKPW